MNSKKNVSKESDNLFFVLDKTPTLKEYGMTNKTHFLILGIIGNLLLL